MPDIIQNFAELRSELAQILGDDLALVEPLVKKGYWLEYEANPRDLPGYVYSDKEHYFHVYPGNTALAFYVATRTDGVTPARATSIDADRQWAIDGGMASPGRLVTLSDVVGRTPPYVGDLVRRALGIGEGVPCDRGVFVPDPHLSSVYLLKGPNLDGATLDGTLRMRRVDRLSIKACRQACDSLVSACDNGPPALDPALVALPPPDDELDLAAPPRPVPFHLDWLPADALTCFYGKPDAGKTTYLLHQLVPAAGIGMFALLWIAADQSAALRSWAPEVARRYGVEDTRRIRFALPRATLDLTGKGQGWQYVRERVDLLRSLWPDLPLVLVIEGLSAVLVGADENGTGTAGFLAEATAEIKRTPGLSVVFTHHANDKGLPRGHGSISGNCEAVVQLAVSGDTRTVVMMKSKRHASGTVVETFGLEVDPATRVPRVVSRYTAAGRRAGVPSAVPPLDEEDAGYPDGLPEHLRPLWRELAARGGRDWFDEAVLGEANRAATPGGGENEKKRRSRHKRELLAGWVAMAEAEGATHYRLRVTPEVGAQRAGPSNPVG